MFDYYDKIIVGIAGSLLGILTNIALHTGLFVGTLVATLLVHDTVFRNPPLPATDPRVAAATIVWHVFFGIVAVAAFAA